MASRFWVGSTGTWDGSTTTNWSATTGGAGGASVPGSADTVTFDGSSGGGVVTVNTNPSITTLTTSAFTGTLDFSANNNNITITTQFADAGTGVHTINMGGGTWTISATSGAAWNISGGANLTLNCNSSTLLFQSTPTGSITFGSGSVTRTYNVVTVNIGSGTASRFIIAYTTGSTIGTLNLTSLRTLYVASGATMNITNALNYTGSSSTPLGIFPASPSGNPQATISSANNMTFTWVGMQALAFTGGGTFGASSSFDLGNNSGITISSPSGGGGGGSHMIGG